MAQAHPELQRETYEDSPDDLKAVLENSKPQEGQVPSARPTRAALLKEHERHLGYLEQGMVPPRKFVLPLPYPPSMVNFSQANYVYIKSLRISSRNAKEMIIVRTVTDSYVHSSSITIIEDENGDVARLTVCNLEDSIIDPVLTKGSVLAVKQPCWSVIPDGGYHIRVDHPPDIVLLDSDRERVPTMWKELENPKNTKTATEWKKEGDIMFLKKKFRKALECYENGRAGFSDDFDSVAQMNMYRKRCNVNIVLLRFDAAAEDLAQAILIHAKSSCSLERSELADVSTVRSWLHSRNTHDTLGMNSQLPRPLKNLAVRIKFDLGLYQESSDYDLAKIYSYVGPLTLHIDAANYTHDTEIRLTSHHGRGLFAKCAFKAGDLVLAEKAFALPGYIENDRSSECSLYSLGDEMATDRAGALLFKELVQKLDANLSVRKKFFEMDDGGYWADHGWEVSNKDEIPIDVFRIEHIRRRNCFAAPIRAIDVLNNPSTPVRNGFWIHTSYINHSCLPNSVRTFIGDLLLLRATRDIAAGEEITAQYVTPELIFFDRQQRYKGTWGFECDCQLCGVDGKVGEEVESQRTALFEELRSTAQRLGNSTPTVTALKKFAKRLMGLESLYSADTYAQLPKLCLVHPTLFLAEAWRGVKHTDKMMESAEKLLRNFGIVTKVEGNEFRVVENSGLINVESVRALKYLAEGFNVKGQTELASSIMVTAKVWFRIITGADVGSDEFLQM